MGPESSVNPEDLLSGNEPQFLERDQYGEEASVIPEGDEESIDDGLEQDIVQSPGDILDKLVMDEDEFKSYLKPNELKKKSTFKDVPKVEVRDTSIEGEDLLYDLVAKAGASIFMDTDDLISEQALNVLKSLKLTMYVVRLDLIEQGGSVKRLLFNYSGLTSLPIIFINGQLIGGYEDLWFLYYTQLVSFLLTKGHPSYKRNFSFEYDLIVIGGGPAGISAALEAAKLGKRVAIVNYVTPSARGRAWGIGGTYINAGSISKNLLYAASNFVHSFSGHGLTKPKKGTPNWKKLVTSICEHIKSITFSLRSKIKETGCDFINAKAKFVTDHTIEVRFPKTGGKKVMTSSVFVIATGSRPRYPKFMQGALEHCYTTDDFFWSAKPPGKTLILASTHIGLECATILANFNFPVSVLVAPPIGKEIDWEILRRAKSHMENIKIKFLQEIQLECIERNLDPGVKHALKVKGLNAKNIPYEEDFDTVLLEYGRVPSTAHLGLCRIGINVHNRTRKIIVDDGGQTNIKHIFALGDAVHAWPELATVAKKAGKTLVQRLYKGSVKFVDLNFVPERILFPVEYARIGKTEQAAMMLYGDKMRPYQAESHILGTLSNSPMRAYFYMKILCLLRDKHEEVIAIHLLCHKASEIIQGLSISLGKGVTRNDFEEIIALHPIFSEVVSNMKIIYFHTPLDVYKAAQEAPIKKAAKKAIQSVEPFKLSKCTKVKKHSTDKPEEQEESDESSKGEKCTRNKGPRISKSMEEFIINVIIKGKDNYEETNEYDLEGSSVEKVISEAKISSVTEETDSSTGDTTNEEETASEGLNEELDKEFEGAQIVNNELTAAKSENSQTATSDGDEAIQPEEGSKTSNENAKEQENN